MSTKQTRIDDAADSLVAMYGADVPDKALINEAEEIARDFDEDAVRIKRSLASACENHPSAS